MQHESTAKLLLEGFKACRNIAAARSANVLVTIHGSGSNNALFMEEGSTLVEIRPYKFGTKAHVWANTFMPKVGLLSSPKSLTAIDIILCPIYCL